MNNNFNWVDEQEKKINEERSKEYFQIAEGPNKFILLSHCAPLAQVFDPSTKKYRIAVEGDSGVSIKGVCWILQEDGLKQAKLPYVVVKQLRSLQQEADWEFTIPFPHALTLNAKGAGTKEVEYTLTPSPKKSEIPASVLAELSKKPTPEEIVEKIKNKAVPATPSSEDTREYPEPASEGLNPEDTPW